VSVVTVPGPAAADTSASCTATTLGSKVTVSASWLTPLPDAIVTGMVRVDPGMSRPSVERLTLHAGIGVAVGVGV